MNGPYMFVEEKQRKALTLFYKCCSAVVISYTPVYIILLSEWKLHYSFIYIHIPKNLGK